ncbi:MAG TPA: hypothetical protein ENH33_01875 [Actinobacteria bacterium]|nr:hypothetical protein [Actinomycetota bacterium]
MAAAIGGDESSTADFQAMLDAIAALESHVRSNQALRDEIPPAPLLDASSWVPLLDDQTLEFAVARSVASADEPAGDPRCRASDNSRFNTVWRPSIRDYLRGTEGRRALKWAIGPSVEVDVERSVVDALCTIHVAHATNARRVDGVAGAVTVMADASWLPREAIEAFAAGLLDDRRLGRLVRFLALLSPGLPEANRPQRHVDDQPHLNAVIPAWRLLAPVFHAQTRSGITVPLAPDRGWPSALARGAVESVVRGSLNRIRSGLGPTKALDPKAVARGVDGKRLAAALLLTPSPRTLNNLVDSLIVDARLRPEEETA